MKNFPIFVDKSMKEPSKELHEFTILPLSKPRDHTNLNCIPAGNGNRYRGCLEKAVTSMNFNKLAFKVPRNSRP